MGTELLFVFALGFLLLGPRKLPAILRHMARAKTQLKEATHAFTTELDATLEPHRLFPEANSHARTGERQ